MMRNYSLLALFVYSFFVGSAYAVEVIEGTPDAVNAATASTVRASGSASGNVNSEMLVRIQQLEEELMEMRGLLEQQSYLIEQLTQRRLADYVSLDRRISELAAGSTISNNSSPGASSTVSTTASITTTPITTTPITTKATKTTPSGAAGAPVVKPAIPPTPVPAASANEAKTAYQSAYEKIKARKFDDAKVAFVAFIADYPQSYYIPNAQFWLGELYYQSSQLSKARDAYYILVTQHANYRKVPRAKFKLGKIYHELGDVDQAKVMLQSVINDHADSKEAGPAREYLNNSLR